MQFKPVLRHGNALRISHRKTGTVQSTSFGDPLLLKPSQARDFAIRLNTRRWRRKPIIPRLPAKGAEHVQSSIDCHFLNRVGTQASIPDTFDGHPTLGSSASTVGRSFWRSRNGNPDGGLISTTDALSPVLLRLFASVRPVFVPRKRCRNYHRKNKGCICVDLSHVREECT